MDSMYQTIELHTSDRQLYKRCRRKWNWQSPLRESLVTIGEINPNLWYGTGIHFALEDWHGQKKYCPNGKSPVEAFHTYVECFKESERPENWPELEYIASESLTYYVDTWHDIYFKQFKTATLYDIAKARNGTLPENFSEDFGNVMMNFPLTEVEFQVPILENFVYAGTLDRIVIDPYGRFWVVDYKTASRIDTMKLETDPQITAYAWSATKYFGIDFEGVIWLQLSKDVPEMPKLLKKGEFSQNKTAKTTYRLYTQALLEEFGEIPERYVDYVNFLAAKEIENGDVFIRYDMVRKNEHQLAMEELHILKELDEMRKPDIYIYPNPTRDCQWDCPFRSACIAVDDGSDYKYILDNEFMFLPGGRDYSWRLNLPE